MNTSAAGEKLRRPPPPARTASQLAYADEDWLAVRAAVRSPRPYRTRSPHFPFFEEEEEKK